MPAKFTRLSIPELILIEPRVFSDDRGYFCETYKKSEYSANGIDAEFVQDNHSFSTKGILRGLHFQRVPHAQGKLVRVIDGTIWDVAVDVRRSSPTFGKWCGVELSGDNHKIFWIPTGFAHGSVCLSETVHLLYKCTAEYNKAFEGGIRWDDPSLNIDWPLKDSTLSEKDAVLPYLKDAVVFY
jgi:dTDP-4-dehydrorhamnose 3,5-epimerase